MDFLKKKAKEIEKKGESIFKKVEDIKIPIINKTSESLIQDIKGGISGIGESVSGLPVINSGHILESAESFIKVSEDVLKQTIQVADELFKFAPVLLEDLVRIIKIAADQLTKSFMFIDENPYIVKGVLVLILLAFFFKNNTLIAGLMD